jgi:hypothetical protein
MSRIPKSVAAAAAGGRPRTSSAGAERDLAGDPRLWVDSAGHGVAVLLKVYAHCVDVQADAASKRIGDALGGGSPEADGEEDQGKSA